MPRLQGRAASFLVVLSAALLLGRAAQATDPLEPKFEHAKPPAKDASSKVEWKASVQAGFVYTSGNSRSATFSAGAAASRSDGKNKIALDVGGVYARSSVLVINDSNKSGAIGPDEITRESQTTAKNWNLKLRYDRFLTTNNALYAAGLVGQDQPAGREVFGGVQAGYSRQLCKSDMHEALAELGYDFNMEKYVAGDDLAIHSLRAFLGYTLTLRKDTSIGASLEALMNLNNERRSVINAGPDVGPFEDSRLNAKVSLTTKLWKALSFRVGFTLRYDHAPAPLPPFKVPFEPGFVPMADPLDTLTEASLIVSVL
jgi:putative salt-induced outer membrane protein YdiY